MPGGRAPARRRAERTYEFLELLDAKLSPAEASHRTLGPGTGRLLLSDEILRLLAEAEDSGRRALTRLEVDERLEHKPVGTSIRGVLDRLRRDQLIASSGSGAKNRSFS